MQIRAMKKQTQNKPNLLDAQMNISSVLTKDYERNDIFAVPENKANSNPIRTQSNPIPQRDTQYAIRDTRYKPNQTQALTCYRLLFSKTGKTSIIVSYYNYFILLPSLTFTNSSI